MPAIQELTADRSKYVRDEVAAVLAVLEESEDGQAPTGKQRRKRRMAAIRSPQAILERNVALLKHEKPSIRASAARRIADQGAAARGAISHLLPLLDDPSRYVADCTQLALHRIDPKQWPPPW
jgi:hypothetical protein